MCERILTACLLIALLPGCAGNRAPASRDARQHPEWLRPDRGALSSILQEQRTRIPELMASAEVPGLAIGLVDRHGPLWLEGFGVLASGFGFKAHMSWYPHLGVGIVVLVNSMDENFMHSLAFGIIDDLARAAGLYDHPRPLPFMDVSPLDAEPAAARRLVGEYLGRGSDRVAVLVDEGRLAMRLEGEVLPLQFASATEAFIDWGGGKRELFRFVLDETDRPLYALRVRYGTHYDFEGTAEATASKFDRVRWDAYLGDYEVTLVDKVLGVMTLSRQGDTLIFDDQRLVEEYRPGLFFDVRGEAPGLRRDPPTWANIPLKKVH